MTTRKSVTVYKAEDKYGPKGTKGPQPGVQPRETHPPESHRAVRAAESRTSG